MTMSDEAQLVTGGVVTEKRHADLSDDGRYRYTLLRAWDVTSPPMLFVMLNPSTADALLDDPTIRRCRGFAKREGAGGIMVVNLYAYRASNPDDLWAAAQDGVDVEGPGNDEWIDASVHAILELGGPVVAAWGARAEPDRAEQVVSILTRAGADLQALGITNNMSPCHPLYLRGDAPLVPYVPFGRKR